MEGLNGHFCHGFYPQVRPKSPFILTAEIEDADGDYSEESIRPLAAEASDGHILSMDDKGAFKALSSGTTSVYFYAQDGKAAAVKVSVSKG
ncbi:hypothetical protein [Chordicoccus furentiruminis]|uniref:hypothetical protein n=1 Tax=Chordicoccus furentiruminis TaxID=2709410 RepID=UPI0023A804C7|nr:hypothetical protein [Chordicoccus furentiruminis]